MTGWEIVFWVAVAGVLYPYALYPALLAVWAWLRPKPIARGTTPGDRPGSVSVVLVVHNEAGRVAGRVAELATLVRGVGVPGELIVVSDGSTDETVAVARACDTGGVPLRVVALPENQGKSAALNVGCGVARHEILALCDVRQTWDAAALARLLENFADPAVGAVSGELCLTTATGALGGVGLYWRFEKWLRRTEARVGSTAGVTGSICAVRRELFRPIPGGLLLDDVYWPLRVVLQGSRVVFEPGAKAYDRLPDRIGAELRRKVRTLAGNFQLVAALPVVLVPWRNPVWFVLVSHKLMRLVAPWSALAVIALGFAIGGPLYGGLALGGALVIALGLAGLVPAVGARSRVLSAVGSLLILNLAAWLAFWVWASGRSAQAWTKTLYPIGPSGTDRPGIEGVSL